MSNATAQEQLMLELVNRARLDPAAEAQRYGLADLSRGLPAGSVTAAAKQALAMNDLLISSARAHSEWMLQQDVFSHTGNGGSDAGQRMTAAGYSFTGSWTWGENLSWTGIFPGPIDVSTAIVEQHRSLFLSDGHRSNILAGAFREVGIDQSAGNFFFNGVDYSASMVTQNYAATGSNVFVTGVAYNDVVNDNFYGIGEGVGNVAVSVSGSGTDQSGAAGGYEIAVAAQSGARTITLGSAVVSVTIGAGNVKLDLVNATEIWTDSTLTLQSGASEVHALGAASINLTGSAGSESLFGNAGSNVLIGNAGADVIQAGGGVDQLYGNEDNDQLYGQSGQDYLSGGDGDDYLSGGADRDVFFGGAGVDTILGGDGDDEFYVRATDASDLIVEYTGGGNDRIFAEIDYSLAFNSAIETLSTSSNAGTANLNLTGSETANVVIGNNGVNRLDGRGGNDTLYGLGGADYFNFSSSLGTSTNFDTIADFVSADDLVFLDDAVFAGLASGYLSSSGFLSAAGAQSAATASQRIIHNTATGDVWFDADGVGGTAAVRFASIGPGTAVFNHDFFVY